MTFWITPCCPPPASAWRPRLNRQLTSPRLAPGLRSLLLWPDALGFHPSYVGSWLGSQSWKFFVRAVVGETVTAVLRSYPGTTYERSSSDLAQPLRTKLSDLPVPSCPDLAAWRSPVGRDTAFLALRRCILRRLSPPLSGVRRWGDRVPDYVKWTGLKW